MELTFNGQIEPGYIKEVKDILENREFMQLGAFSHHQSTSRLMHSINVSYISWHIARKLGCDARMAARAGLLHDFCLYDFREKPPTGGFQAFYHPRVAARNSQEVFGISEREKSAILSHMFPLGPVQRTGRRGSLPWPTRSVHPWNTAISISPWSGAAGWWSPPTTDRSRT